MWKSRSGKESKLGDRMWSQTLIEHPPYGLHGARSAIIVGLSRQCCGHWTFNQTKTWSERARGSTRRGFSGILKSPKVSKILGRICFSKHHAETTRRSISTVLLLYITPYQSATREDPNCVLVYIIRFRTCIEKTFNLYSWELDKKIPSNNDTDDSKFGTVFHAHILSKS